jgi:hypothetical protein
MVIMVLNPSLKKSLITTCIAVVLFRFAMGLLDRKNTLAVTVKTYGDMSFLARKPTTF